VTPVYGRKAPFAGRRKERDALTGRKRVDDPRKKARDGIAQRSAQMNGGKEKTIPPVYLLNATKREGGAAKEKRNARRRTEQLWLLNGSISDSEEETLCSPRSKKSKITILPAR